MSAYSKVYSQASDKNCERSCSLMYGICQRFETNVKDQQTFENLISKVNLTTTTFDDPIKERKFSPILKDMLMKKLDHPSDKEIFRKALEGMEQNYPGILNGEQKHLFMCPTAFNYDARIKTYETVAPEVLEKKLDRTMQPNVQPLTFNDRHNLRTLQNYAARMKPQTSEQEVFDAFATFFYPNRGILVHSMKMDSYLKVFIDKARSERLRKDNLGIRLTPLEKRIANALNISSEELNEYSDKVNTRLQEMGLLIDGKDTNGRKIRDAVDCMITDRDVRTKARSKFKSTKNYTVSQITRSIRLAKFEAVCKFSGENDLFIMLPDKKLILCIEVKRHMRKPPDQCHGNIDGNLQSASDQLRKTSDYTSRMYGSMLSPGWKFVKIAAISPHVYNPDKICKSCHRFIITTDMITQPGGIEKWWKGTGLDRIVKLDEKTIQKSYDEFLMFFNRLVNLSAVRVHPDLFKTWEQIQGGNPRQMSGGYTKPLQPGTSSHLLDLNDILQRPHDAYKVVRLNDDQDLLLSNDIPLALFYNDFGSGKTTLCKEKARQKAEMEEDAENSGLKPVADRVFYISLVGVDLKGKVDPDEYIFDIYTKLFDFLDTDVEAKSAQDLWDFYSQHHNEKRSSINIYELLEYFIEKHSNGHFIVDECSVLEEGRHNTTKSLNNAKEFIRRCRSKLGDDKTLWISFQSNVFADLGYVSEDFNSTFVDMKNKLSKEGFALPELAFNMRNTKNIAKIKVNDNSLFVMQNSIDQLNCGTNVLGEIPTLLRVTMQDWEEKKSQILMHVLESLKRPNRKNVAVLHDWNIRTKDIEAELQMIKNQTVVIYPVPHNKEEGIENIKNFAEITKHILVTQDRYFNGAEAPNVVYINSGNFYGVRNVLMRAVNHLVVIKVIGGSPYESDFCGMKEDNTFYDPNA